MSAPASWSSAAGSYSAAPVARLVEEAADAALDLLAADVPTLGRADIRFVDVAAGPGTVSFRLLRRRPQAPLQVLVTDFAQGMLDKAAARLAAMSSGSDVLPPNVSVSFEVMDAQALALPDGSVTHLACMFGIMFLPRPEAGLEEMVRVLAPGGRAVVGTWHSAGIADMSIAFSHHLGIATAAVVDPLRAIVAVGSDPDELSAAMSAAGMVDVTVKQVTLTATFEDPDSALEVIKTNPASASLFASAPTGEALRAAWRAFLETEAGKVFTKGAAVECSQTANIALGKKQAGPNKTRARAAAAAEAKAAEERGVGGMDEQQQAPLPPPPAPALRLDGNLLAAEEGEDVDAGAFSGPSSSRLKFVHAQILDSSVEADEAENDSSVVGSIANALSISVANESARIENAITVSEMDLAIQSLQQWRQQREALHLAVADAGEDVAAEDGSGSNSGAILQQMRQELLALGGDGGGGGGGGDDAEPAERTAARSSALRSIAAALASSSSSSSSSASASASSGAAMVDLSRLEQQQALLLAARRQPAPPSSASSASSAANPALAAATASPASAGAASAGGAADASSTSPEAQRLELLISNAQSDALLSRSHEQLEARLLGEGRALEGGVAALQDALRDLELDFDAVLARSERPTSRPASSSGSISSRK